MFETPFFFMMNGSRPSGLTFPSGVFSGGPPPSITSPAHFITTLPVTGSVFGSLVAGSMSSTHLTSARLGSQGLP